MARRWMWVAFSLASMPGVGAAAEVWEQPRTPVLRAAELGLTGLTARDCGACHTEIYREWRSSVHAAAWWDPQFQAELHKDPEVGWLCLNCHTPVANQQEMLAQSTAVRDPDPIDNPFFDAAFREEGVSCLSCHWTPTGIASVHEDAVAPHTLTYTPTLRGDSVCIGCHQVQARLEDALVCDFNTAGEKEAAGIKQSCTECHMPSVQRPVVDGGAVRTSGRHDWPGSGIGKAEGSAVPGLNGLDVSVSRTADARPGFWMFSLELTNVRAGHMLPSGDPERFLRVAMSLESEDGSEVASTQWRIGQTWVWSPVAEKRADNRIAPGEVRILDWEPRTVPGSVFLRVKVEHVRLSRENLEYHIRLIEKGASGPTVSQLRNYPLGRTMFERRWSVGSLVR